MNTVSDAQVCVHHLARCWQVCQKLLQAVTARRMCTRESLGRNSRQPTPESYATAMLQAAQDSLFRCA